MASSDSFEHIPHVKGTFGPHSRVKHAPADDAAPGLAKSRHGHGWMLRPDPAPPHNTKDGTDDGWLLRHFTVD